jgi:hypothetical protein
MADAKLELRVSKRQHRAPQHRPARRMKETGLRLRPLRDLGFFKWGLMFPYSAALACVLLGCSRAYKRTSLLVTRQLVAAASDGAEFITGGNNEYDYRR